VVGLKTIGPCSVVSANGTPSSKSLVTTAEKSLKKSASSFAYLSTYCLKALSDTKAMSVGSIMSDFEVLSSYCRGCQSLPLIVEVYYTYLLGTIPLLPVPLLVQKEFVVFVRDNSWAECPWSVESASSGVTSAKGVCTTQCDNLLVVETHAVENVSQVLVSLRSVGQTSVRCASSNVLVHTAWPIWDGRALHLLDCNDASEDPKVGVGNPRVFFYRILSVHNVPIELV
jgi:hypothetical protein